MKEYEEQVAALRKDNFNLKLRVYLLEERLGAGAGGGGHELQLQGRLEAARRELAEQQQLLREAARALEAAEGAQGAHCPLPASRCHSDGKKTETISEETLQLDKLKQENINACQMVQGCLKRICQMEKDNEKLRASLQRKEDRVSGLQAQLEGALRSRGSDLTNQEQANCLSPEPLIPVKAVQKNIEELLTGRLQEMAFFLDSLLSHKCILGEDKRRKVANLLEQSLELPVGLQLDPSASVLLQDSFSENALGLSRSFRLEDITTLLGHHDVSQEWSAPTDPPGAPVDPLVQRDATIRALRTQLDSYITRCTCLSSSTDDLDNLSVGDRKLANVEMSKLLPKRKTNRRESTHWNDQARCAGEESEGCWSEPDRRVSQARMLNPASGHSSEHSAAELLMERDRLQTSLENSQQDMLQLVAQSKADRDQRDLQIKQLQEEINLLTLTVQQAGDNLHQAETTYQLKIKQLEKENEELTQALAISENNILKLKQLEKENEELKQALEISENNQTELKRAAEEEQARLEELEEVRCPSPDLGIDSDRLSSLEPSGPPTPTPTLQQQNCLLREQLRAAQALLRAARLQQTKHERAICLQVHKTTSILRQVRSNMK